MTAPAAESSMSTALVLAPPRPDADSGPGFWAAFGHSLGAAARSVGRGVLTAVRVVDLDARKDLAKMPLVALTAMGRRNVPVRSMPDDGHSPVIFVHGLAGHRGNFLPMRTWFRLHGRTRTYALGLSGKGGIRGMARELSAFIAEVAQVNELADGDTVDLIAHSMGGVVCRLALADATSRSRVGTVVTLGSPHGGTAAARFVGTSIGQELRPGSDVVNELRDQQAWTDAPKLVCFWSGADPLMQPASTARVPGADNREVLGATHIDWLLDRGVWEVAREACRPEPQAVSR